MSYERHNALRDTEAKIMEEVCKDVRIKTQLIQIERETVRGNDAPKARLDVSARGVWSQNEKTFYDVRVTHPNTESNHFHTTPLYNNRRNGA